MLRTVLRSSPLMPVRVTLRVAVNSVAAVLYIVYNIFFVYIGGPDMKRRPADDATRRPPHVTTVIYVAARALIRETHADLSLGGG